MKRTLLISTFILLFSQKALSEFHQHALGVRSLSGSIGFGGEVSYQYAVGDANRIEFDLGWSRNTGNAFGFNNRFGFIAATGIYQWVNEIMNGFSWYNGVGVQLINYNSYNSGVNYRGFSFGVGGQVGIEYDFNELDFPFQASLDFRPMWIIGNRIKGYTIGSALSLRYTF